MCNCAHLLHPERIEKKTIKNSSSLLDLKVLFFCALGSHTVTIDSTVINHLMGSYITISELQICLWNQWYWTVIRVWVKTTNKRYLMAISQIGSIPVTVFSECCIPEIHFGISIHSSRVFFVERKKLQLWNAVLMCQVVVVFLTMVIYFIRC